MEKPLQGYRLDRSAFAITSIEEAPEDKQFWIMKTPAERLAVLEFMRQVMYGYDPATARLQRVLTITQRPSG